MWSKLIRDAKEMLNARFRFFFFMFGFGLLFLNHHQIRVVVYITTGSSYLYSFLLNSVAIVI